VATAVSDRIVVCSRTVEDDGLTFLRDTIRVERILDDEAYEGVRVRLEARLGKLRVALRLMWASETRSHQRLCMRVKRFRSSEQSPDLLPA
jgi:hypothetical protein